MSSVVFRNSQPAAAERVRWYVRINQKTNVFKIVSREEMLATLRGAFQASDVPKKLGDMAWGKTLDFDGFWWRMSGSEA